jgi:hypothetical protein
MNTHKSILLFTLVSFSTSAFSVEIIPLLGMRGGGEFVDDNTDQKHTLDQSETYGLILSFHPENTETYEIYYSHQSTELKSLTISGAAPSTNATLPLSIDYLHFGGTTTISDQTNLKTFVSGGLGLTYLSPDLVDTQSDLRASFSLGLGLKWPMTDRLSLRLETRGLATLFANNSAVFCNGGCELHVNGSFFLQAEVFAGLGFKF